MLRRSGEAARPGAVWQTVRMTAEPQESRSTLWRMEANTSSQPARHLFELVIAGHHAHERAGSVLVKVHHERAGFILGLRAGVRGPG